jgi:hypothetical protein
LYFPIFKIQRSLENYYQDCETYPTELEGLEELLFSEKECWIGPYLLQQDLVDRMSQQKFKYFINQEGYEIVSVGKDKFIKTEDDFKSSDNKVQKQKIIYLYKSQEDFESFMNKVAYITLIFLILVLLKYRKLVVSIIISALKFK